MSNAIYPEGREAFGNAQIAWLTDDIRLVIMDSTYVYGAAHQFHSDLTGILATSANFAGKTNVGGVMDADNVTLSAVPIGDTIETIAIYKWTGVSGTSPLICFFDRNAASVLISVDTDNGDVLVRWSNGATKIFRL